MPTAPMVTQPKFWQTSQWILDPVGYMQTQFKRYGDIFQASVAWSGNSPFVFVNEPKAVQYMLTHDTGKDFTAPGELNAILEPLIGRQNLILLSGQQHRRRRQLVMPPFHGERLKAYGQTIQQITAAAISQWPVDERRNIRPVMQKITMRVILQVVFGLHQGERYEQLERLLSLRMEMTDTPLASVIIFMPWLQKDYGAWSPGARIQRLAEETDTLLFAEIKERRANPDPARIDILSLLLAAKDEDGNGLSDQDLRDELMTLLVAGHETTATALTWAMYWVNALPEVKQTLLTELDALSDPSDLSEVLQLPYLNAVCNETLRIYPVAMLTFPRQLQVPLELCGHQLEPGMLLMGCIYLIHHREDLYPEPRQFRPERFLERQYSPYEFLPFGGGVRRCVGYALAQYELKIALATMLTQADMTLMNKRPIQPARRGVTLGPNQPVQIKKVGVRARAKTLVGV